MNNEYLFDEESPEFDEREGVSTGRGLSSYLRSVARELERDEKKLMQKIRERALARQERFDDERMLEERERWMLGHMSLRLQPQRAYARYR